ncbi:polymer-forming cytoskeletal protein [Tuberibacillus sp. Marseille-P3662]|uniref:polymer-forming cytoskeletal protein n=1 Tax=Tuberibacillus sp. Marseille-P3662 TaxID=1965358 RepID=UPI000A1CC109|nr:polymer-forming cytoskeletal protein [Tuberibacillus sp. Marseille-P3662]
MEREKLRDLDISGSGSVAGGLYDSVDISGSGKVTGDIECRTFDASGSSHVKGDIHTHSFDLSGSSHVHGDVTAVTIDSSGSSHISGHVITDQLESSGAMRVGKDLTGKTLDISGFVTIGGDCTADLFNAQGAFTVGGVLNANTIDVRLDHDAKADKILGESIQIRKRQRWSFISKLLDLFLTERALKADLIEGHYIILENTVAKIVRGDNVYIGRGCDIDVVEYSTDCHVNDDADVATQRKIDCSG